MRKAILPVAAVVVAAVVIGALVTLHGSSTSTPPPQRMRQAAPAFLRSVVRLLVANRYAAAWETLNPADKHVASRAAYVRCEEASPIRARLVSLRVLAVGDERVRLAPHGPTVRSVAVTFGAILEQGGSKSPTVLHLHAVAAGSGWTWILPPGRYALYESGGCGGSPPPHP